MNAIGRLLGWFAGGPAGYMDLAHCMNHDWGWIALTVVLDLTIAAGYIVIALHWWRNERPLRESPAKAGLRNMKIIFVFCGLCGYVFIPIKMFWPAWRLYDAFLIVLAIYTWRYAWGARGLNVIYRELGRSERLAEDLETSRAESKRKSHFLNAISHDLKTPLNGLMLQAELAELYQTTDDRAALKEALVEIKTCARTTADLLNYFLEIGRLDWSDESSRVTRFDIGTLVRDVLNLTRARAEMRGLHLVAHAPTGLLVETDRVKVERVLLNLMDNALKFTTQGEIELRVDARQRDMIVRVRDTGVGIAEEHRSLIFDDFFQVRNRERDSSKGFGLGLPIARRLARQVGGDLLLESVVGHGSEFTLFLPNAVAGDLSDHPPARSIEPAHAGKAATTLG